MAPKIFGILFIVFALGLALYFYRLEPIKKLGLDDITLPKIFSTSTSGKESTPTIEEKPETYFVQASKEPEISPYEIPEGFTLKELSPYFHKVRLGSVSPGFGSDYPGQISLYTSYSEGEKAINVTGWHLKARDGSQYIPRAINIYDPLGLAPAEDIYLRNGDILYIYTNTSVIGQNLRLNKCIGYLENVNQFNPPLPRNCPTPSRFEISNFTGICQDYILSLSSCVFPDSNPPVPYDDYACRQYLETINYKGCYEKYRSDPDFLDREWRVWTGSQFLDERHDRLLLLDTRGLLVDLYEY